MVGESNNFKVIRFTSWKGSSGPLGSLFIDPSDNLVDNDALHGRLTQLIYKPYLEPFYTRENINGINSFCINSGERWGDKTGKKPRNIRQTLELCCNPSFYSMIAPLIREDDPFHRPVWKNKNLTFNWAEKQFHKE